ncbi:MAG: helix-turn-helix domain-containing protein [Aggregatilineaceae bacterium]
MADEINIGLRIKQRRQEIGLSLREVARRAKVTASFLSQLERGLSNASLDSLRRIAEALEIPMMHLLFDDSHDSGEKLVFVLRAGHRPKLNLRDSRVSYELLTPDLNRQMEVVLGRLSPGSGNVARPLKVPTEECIYVLSGCLKVVLGAEEFVLCPGDSVYFAGVQLRELMCASEDEDAVWLSFITPPAF